MKPKVSIILVNFNGDKDTIDCVESLKKISYDNYEIIIVDNNSANCQELEAFVNNNSDIIFLKSKENLGFSRGNNIGIKYAINNNADYVLLLNNDTTVKTDFLDELVSSATNCCECGIVSGKILFYDFPEKIWFAGGRLDLNKASIQHIKSDELNDKKDKTITFATGCLMLIPRNVIEKVGMLSEEFFMYSEDVEYCCRVQKSNYKIIYNPNSVIYHKVGLSSGGRGSKFSQYYRTRNDMIVLSKWATNKKKAYFFYILRLVKRILVGQFQIKYTFLGLKDFINGVSGKKERI